MVKYGELARVGLHSRDDSHGFGLWKAIGTRWDYFSRFAGFGLGDARKIRFWEDVWLSNRRLASLYLVVSVSS